MYILFLLNWKFTAVTHWTYLLRLFKHCISETGSVSVMDGGLLIWVHEMKTARDIGLLISPIGVIWLITCGGWGSQNWPWVLWIKLERGEDCFESVLNIHTPLSTNLTPILLFVCLQLSSQKLFLGGINIGGELFDPPPKLCLWFHLMMDNQFTTDFVTKMTKWRVSYVRWMLCNFSLSLNNVSLFTALKIPSNAWWL